MDDEHVLALVEAVHGAHFDAVHDFAANAALVDDVGQLTRPFSNVRFAPIASEPSHRSESTRCARSCLPRRKKIEKPSYIEFTAQSLRAAPSGIRSRGAEADIGWGAAGTEDKAPAAPQEADAAAGGRHQTDNPAAPAFYIMKLAAVSAIAMLMTKDRTNIGLDEE
jgi:hypothetical protein